jgi:regulator of replication initiation timing
MSMDIVIRLRKETSPLMHDAAREIERLRAMQQDYREEASALRVENERLRAALIYIRDNGEYMSGTSCADHANTALEQNGDDRA